MWVVEVVFVVVVTMLEDFVYVVSLIGVSFVLVFLFIDFGDSPLLGVSYRFFFLDFFFDSRVYGISIGGFPSILCMLLL
jgi:hypothetical protein